MFIDQANHDWAARSQRPVWRPQTKVHPISTARPGQGEGRTAPRALILSTGLAACPMSQRPNLGERQAVLRYVGQGTDREGLSRSLSRMKSLNGCMVLLDRSGHDSEAERSAR
jgi:hypothetical protein